MIRFEYSQELKNNIGVLGLSKVLSYVFLVS